MARISQGMLNKQIAAEFGTSESTVKEHGEVYAGQHEAILERGLWERVQQHLVRRRKMRREGTSARVPSLLLGRVYNDSGQRYTPTHSSKSAKRYRYYVLQAAGQQPAIGAAVVRIPALDLERLVLQRLLAWLSD